MKRATLALGATVLVALGVAGTASAAQPDKRHAWLWKPNPSGFFNDWNPRVFC